jgi:hypothetical protein
MSSDYRLAPGFAARLLGVLVVGLGLLVLAVVLLGALLGLAAAVVLTVVLVAALAVGVVGLGVLRAWVVRFDDEGYRVRFVRGAGVRTARWREVAEAATTTSRGVRCVELQLKDQRTTTIPVVVLDTGAGGPDGFVRDLRERLRRGEGLTPLGDL